MKIKAPRGYLRRGWGKLKTSLGNSDKGEGMEREGR